MKEDVGRIKDRFHALGVGHEVGRDIALVELHPFDDVEGGFDGFCLFNRDGSVLADLVHCIGDDVADCSVPVCGHRCDLSDFCPVLDLLRNLSKFHHDCFHSLVDAALERGWVCAGGHVLETFAVDCFSKNGRSRGSVSSHVAGFGCHFANELCAHVFIGIFQLDFLGDGDAVLGDGW